MNDDVIIILPALILLIIGFGVIINDIDKRIEKLEKETKK